MKKHISLLLLLFLFFACQNKKIEKIADLACQDTKDLVESYASAVVPHGDAVLNSVVKEDMMNSAVCDCIRPSLKKHLQSYSETELEEQITDKSRRSKSVRKAILQNPTDILTCYKDKGLKGMAMIQGFIKQIMP